jgi:hypothetical protein
MAGTTAPMDLKGTNRPAFFGPCSVPAEEMLVNL